MGLEFLRDHGAHRMASYQPLPPMFDPPEGQESEEDVELDYETCGKPWTARPPEGGAEWRVREWAERPTRFIDGKDVGETVAWLQSPEGEPVPVRLSEIGAIAVRVEDGEVRREQDTVSVERVVSMVGDAFPWHEVESFAVALRGYGFRLLNARRPGGRESYDFEKMRKAAQNRSNDEMGLMEEAALAQGGLEPAVVDGRLEPRQGGIVDPARMPVVGVIKTHREIYLHPRGLMLLTQLGPGERTPLFALRPGPKDAAGGDSGASRQQRDRIRLPVVSFYLRLSGDARTMPNWGIVRVELPKAWFDQRRNTDGYAYVAHLCRMLCDYRTRNQGYGRAAVSLHPIVRAEELLGALFTPSRMLGQRFCHLTGL